MSGDWWRHIPIQFHVPTLLCVKSEEQKIWKYCFDLKNILLFGLFPFHSFVLFLLYWSNISVINIFLWCTCLYFFQFLPRKLNLPFLVLSYPKQDTLFWLPTCNPQHDLITGNLNQINKSSNTIHWYFDTSILWNLVTNNSKPSISWLLLPFAFNRTFHSNNLKTNVQR